MRTHQDKLIILHASGSVDADNLAVYPLTVLGGEEGNNAGNVDGLTNAVVWRPGLGVLVNLVVIHLVSARNVLLADCVIHIGLDTTWSNAVDSNLLVTSIDGHATGKSLDGPLATRVDGVFWNTLGLTGDGAH